MTAIDPDAIRARAEKALETVAPYRRDLDRGEWMSGIGNILSVEALAADVFTLLALVPEPPRHQSVRTGDVVGRAVLVPEPPTDDERGDELERAIGRVRGNLHYATNADKAIADQIKAGRGMELVNTRPLDRSDAEIEAAGESIAETGKLTYAPRITQRQIRYHRGKAALEAADRAVIEGRNG